MPVLFKGRVASRLNRAVIFIAALVTVISVAASAFFYIKDRPVRNRDAVYSAWQIVANMEGKKGSGGREAAIAQLLNHGEDLSGINLDSGFLKDVDMSNISCRGGSFTQTVLSNAFFNNSHLSSVSFKSARLSKAQLINASLDYIDFIGSVITDAELGSAQLTHCIGDSVTTFNGSSFENSKIAYSQFLGSNFDNTIFTNSSLVEVMLSGSFMRRSKLENTSWRHTKARFLDMSLSEANNISVGASSDLGGSRFDRTKLQFAIFEHVDLTSTSFFSSDLTGARFVDSNLYNADFSSSVLKNARFENCMIDGLNLSGVDQSNLEFVNCTGKPIELLINSEPK